MSLQVLTPDVVKVLPKEAQAGLACDAAANGDVKRARELVAAGVNMNCSTPHDLRTPLHIAASTGNLKMLKFLVEECRATLQCDRFGLLPINDAVQNGHAAARQYLQSMNLALPENRRQLRVRADSLDMDFVPKGERPPSEEMLSTVFELVVKDGIFNYSTVHAEVTYYFKGLGLHNMYFDYFTPLQIAKHIHCLIAAKRVARATDDVGSMDFALTSLDSGFFLAAMTSPEPTKAELRTLQKAADHLTAKWKDHDHISLSFMASEASVFKNSKEKLGIFYTQWGGFDATRILDDETSLEALASARFLKEKSRQAKEQYQIIVEDVVAARRACVRIVPSNTYPGPDTSGFVLVFGTLETTGRHYLMEICQAMRFVGLSPRRFYMETFANRIITYTLFFPSAKRQEVQKLGTTIMYSTHLNTSSMIYGSVMETKISHEVGLYLSAVVKFVYALFPKEQYAPEYTHVHEVLAHSPGSQLKLEALYKLCMRELLSTERIYNVIERHMELAVRFFEDFRSIALGKAPPQFNTEIAAAIDSSCRDQQDRQILKMFLTFNEGCLLTNFFKEGTPGAMAFRLNPKVVLKDRPASLYPEIPYGIYLISARNFVGFHVRFRDVARGGIRLVLSRDKTGYERNLTTLFDEAYNLSFTQQMKNKDIPEGGAKGVILPDFDGFPKLGSEQSPAAQRLVFTRYLDALLDCMMPEQSGIFSGHMKEQKEILFFGPDENTANVMDLGAELSRTRGYPYWKALTTGKSVRLGGVPHDVYGMTTASVHVYVVELLKALGEEEESITKFQTGGPDGDLGSNEIMVSKDQTVAIVDGSGVAYDPTGLNRSELMKLAKRRVPIKEFSPGYLGKDGFLVRVEQTDITLPDGSKWATGAELRDNFHLTKYATADLFVPCGGRPNSVTEVNVNKLFENGTPKFRMVVEGANLFFSDGARTVLEKAGVHVFKDASTNKGGVCSSSLEVFSALALADEDHSALMTYDPDDSSAQPPEFYQTYVTQIKDIIIENARQEFRTIWACNQKDGLSKLDSTKAVSKKINHICDDIQDKLRTGMSAKEKDLFQRGVLMQAVPDLMIKRLGVDAIMARVPPNYIASIVGAWVASRFVYRHGINSSEVDFFIFMRAMAASFADKGVKRPADARSTGDGARQKLA